MMEEGTRHEKEKNGSHREKLVDYGSGAGLLRGWSLSHYSNRHNYKVYWFSVN